MYAIMQTDMGKNKDDLYLNHAYLSTMAFGSEDMAWTTDDEEKAELMLFKVNVKGQRCYQASSEFEIVEI